MLNIKATNMDLTDAIRDYVEKKIEGLEKFTKGKNTERMYVDVGRSTNHHKQGDVYKAEFNVVIDGEHFTTFAETEDLHAAVDEAYTELVRQVTERKDHQISIVRRGARSIKKMLKGLSGRNPFTSLKG
jgi:putative sigma-54 modulation protein